MKKLIAILIATVAIVGSCSKVEPTTLDYSKYTNKATLVVQTQVNGSNKGGITVNITVGQVHLERVSDKNGLVEEVIGFNGSTFMPSVTALWKNGNDYYHGAGVPTDAVGPDDVCKVVVDLTKRNLE